MEKPTLLKNNPREMTSSDCHHWMWSNRFAAGTLAIATRMIAVTDWTSEDSRCVEDLPSFFLKHSELGSSVRGTTVHKVVQGSSTWWISLLCGQAVPSCMILRKRRGLRPGHTELCYAHGVRTGWRCMGVVQTWCTRSPPSHLLHCRCQRLNKSSRLLLLFHVFVYLTVY